VHEPVSFDVQLAHSATASIPIIQAASATHVAPGLRVSALAASNCVPVAKESKDPPPTIANNLSGLSTEPATSTSTIVTNTVSDCHGFRKPAGLRVGYTRVRVWVSILQPSPYPYP